MSRVNDLINEMRQGFIGMAKTDKSEYRAMWLRRADEEAIKSGAGAAFAEVGIVDAFALGAIVQDIANL